MNILNKKNKIFLFFFSLVIFSFNNAVAENLTASPLTNVLSSRHANLEVNELLKLAGSEDELVRQLLVLRRESKPPMLGTRAQKILLTFNERSDVKEAFIQDVSDPAYFGLGSIVLSSMKNFSDKDFVKKLISEATSKTKSNTQVSKRYNSLINDLPPDFFK